MNEFKTVPIENRYINGIMVRRCRDNSLFGRASRCGH